MPEYWNDPFVDDELAQTAATLSADDLQATDDPEDLLGMDRDLRSARDPLFLGAYSQRGFLTLLERYGLAEHLAKRGYQQLEVDVGADQVRLLAAATPDQPPALLVDFRARVEERAHPPLDLAQRRTLVIEWLSVESPRESFSSERPALPGQRHPGLHLGRAARGLLALLARRLDCEQVVAVPERPHLALLYHLSGYRSLLPGVDDQAPSLAEAATRLPFELVAWAADKGAMRRRTATGVLTPFHYVPRPLLLPVSKAASERFAVPSDPGRDSRPRLFLNIEKLQEMNAAGGVLLTPLADELREPSTETELPRPRWMVGFDGSSSAERALREAAAALAGKQGELVVVHSLSPWADADHPLYAGVAKDADELDLDEIKVHAFAALTKAVSNLVPTDDVELRPVLQTGLAPAQLVEAGPREGADMLVVGSHGRSGLERMLLGSVAERVARDAEQPVLVVKDADPARAAQRPSSLPPARLAVCVDVSPGRPLSPAALASLRLALDFAHVHQASLWVVHLGRRSSSPPWALGGAVGRALKARQQERAAGRKQRLGALVRFCEEEGVRTNDEMLAEDDGGESLRAAALRHSWDLLVVGRHDGAPQLQRLGSTAGRILQLSPSPVLVVPPLGGL